VGSQPVDPSKKARVRCVVGTLPHIDFEEGTFSAILCSRVLHFLDSSDIELSLSKMYRWLHRGGRVFLIVDTPYSGATKDCVVPEYERKKALSGKRRIGFVQFNEKEVGGKPVVYIAQAGVQARGKSKGIQ
jgi:ubiquinone/menaquinone biosynthesis C-methylase UbiE